MPLPAKTVGNTVCKQMKQIIQENLNIIHHQITAGESSSMRMIQRCTGMCSEAGEGAR